MFETKLMFLILKPTLIISDPVWFYYRRFKIKYYITNKTFIIGAMIQLFVKTYVKALRVEFFFPFKS